MRMMLKYLTLRPSYKKLDLTLWTSRPRWPLRDYVILGLGLVMMAGVVSTYLLKLHTLQQLQASLSNQLSRQKSIHVTTPAEIQALQLLSARWAFPWGTLFSALERAKTDNVILLSLAPDTTTRTVLIEAQTDDVYAMLNYVTALKQQPALRNVILSRHEQDLESVAQPVKFSVSAEWFE